MLLTYFFILLVVSLSNTLPLEEFFPFGSQVDDHTLEPNDDNTTDPLELPYIFPYFDNNHRTIWIANNGLFSFLSPIRQFVPDPFPLANGNRLVAGFWTDIDTRGKLNETGNKLYYQMYSDIRPTNYTLSVFNKVKDYVRNFFPQQRPFESAMVIVATWFRVGAYPQQTDELNTFQIVLATDGDRSFVFFLYHELQWAKPMNNMNNNSYAQAGFNAGDGFTFETLPYSNTEDIVQLVDLSNVNIPGLFAYRVDTDSIDAGGCDGNVTTVVFRPRMSSQFGSTALHMQGPCFNNETLVKCQFGPSLGTVDGFVIDEFRAVCLTPFASKPGRVLVNISIDNGQTYSPAGIFTYAPLQFDSDEVIIEIEGDDHFLEVGQNVTLKWHFSEMTRNIFPNDTTISIELWKVFLDNQDQLKKNNSPIILAQDLNLNNSIRIQLPTSISYITTCFIRVVARLNSHIYAGLNTGLLVVRSPPSLAPELCQDWARQQPHPGIWNNDSLLLCPMTRWQASAGGLCCYRPDPQCYQSNSDHSNCWFHQGRPGRNESSAVECYLSIGSNRQGAGTECCYDTDGMIITRGTGAGTDNRYEPTSSPIKHFFHDTLPYFHCCMMSTNNAACRQYMLLRPPRRGSNTRDGNGGMWGDPHFGTMDALSYTFNGYGEYTYLAISNETSSAAAFDSGHQSFIFMSQIRTGPLLSSNVTVIRGFAASVDHQSISFTISRREKLLLYRGNEPIEFEDHINTIHFPELTLTRLDGPNNTHFSLAWNISVTIEITVIELTSPSRSSALNIRTSLAEIFRNRTYGLLGNYDGIAENDLRSDNGTIINSNASLEQIHHEFGVTWAIDPLTSLFHYESDQSAEYFHEQNHMFIPSFIDPTENANSTIRTICNINNTSIPSLWTVAQRTCYYDFVMTDDMIFAQTSFQTADELQSIRNNQINPPLFTLSLPTTMNLRVSELVYLNISTSSEYPTHTIKLSVLHQPVNSIFNQRTGLFYWNATIGEHYLSIEARDMNTNLKAKYDIEFNVNGTSESIINPTTGSHSSSNGINYIIFISTMIILLWN